MAVLVSDAERWERRTATVAADELDAWVRRVTADGWELAVALPIVRVGAGRGVTYYVLLRRPIPPRAAE